LIEQSIGIGIGIGVIMSGNFAASHAGIRLTGGI